MKLSYELFTIAAITATASAKNTAFVANQLSNKKPCSTLAMRRRSLIPSSRSLLRPSKFFQDVDEFFEDFDDFFERPTLMKLPNKLFSDDADPFKDLAISRQRTNYNIEDAEDKVTLSVDAPGMKAEDIDVKLEHDGRVIRLSGMKKSKEGDVEIESRFDKAFMLGKNRFETDNIKANLVDGVLTVIAPKRVDIEMKEKKIKVTETAPEVASKKAAPEVANEKTTPEEKTGEPVEA